MSNSPITNSRVAIKTILLSWLLVGTLDIICAMISFYIKGGTNLAVIFRYIASAIFGSEQVQQMDPTVTAIIGFCLHYLVALIWTLVFFFLYPRIPAMRKNHIATGFVYGFFMQAIMSQVVVKLSRAAQGPFNFTSFFVSGMILVIAIGIPLSFIAFQKESGARSQESGASSQE